MGSAPRIPPVPVDAYINAGRTLCVVAFDQFLSADAALNVANWAVVHGFLPYTTTAALAAGRRVELTLTTGVGEPPQNGVTYSPPPSDVLSRWAIPVAGFANYPIREGP